MHQFKVRETLGVIMILNNSLIIDEVKDFRCTRGVKTTSEHKAVLEQSQAEQLLPMIIKTHM